MRQAANCTVSSRLKAKVVVIRCRPAYPYFTPIQTVYPASLFTLVQSKAEKAAGYPAPEAYGLNHSPSVAGVAVSLRFRAFKNSKPITDCKL